MPAAIVSLVGNLVLGAFTGPLALIYIYKLYGSLKATRGDEAPTAGFKKWLIAFLIIGLYLCVLTITAVFIVTGTRGTEGPAYRAGPFTITAVRPGPNGTTTDYFPNRQQ